ncbi:hypothetical protein RvY_04596 [Ramazzottius varieornatus]|uniref:Uncharacterized protein n=1 Tax=Ramazzottius varieornatus TaxID=947166 RepID=A0A1D1UVP0_RAMVA|nr:hypothetical protein RvY_04596 [Ramazzottius varieornatus]
MGLSRVQQSFLMEEELVVSASKRQSADHPEGLGSAAEASALPMVITQLVNKLSGFFVALIHKHATGTL